jgi:hypothetical protein
MKLMGEANGRSQRLHPQEYGKRLHTWTLKRKILVEDGDEKAGAVLLIPK